MEPSDNSSERRGKILEQYQRILEENASNASQLQAQILKSRKEGLEKAAEIIRSQAAAAGAPMDAGSLDLKPVLYNRAQLEEFASGDAEKCFGPAYAVYRGRRACRIPNGDLLLMSRVLSVTGERFQTNPGSEIVVEYDVPADAWFFKDNSFPETPYSVLMEIALQPCGFLAAHLGTPLRFPDQDYFFRNLDGEAQLLTPVDLRGRTVTTYAVLQKTMVSGTQIIQGLDFRLVVDGQVFFKGNSMFGFFPPEAMANQAGLDKGQETVPLFEQSGQAQPAGVRVDLRQSGLYNAAIGKPFYRLPDGHMKLLDEAVIWPESGNSQKGTIYARKAIDPADWFYACHFFQDPVMPGSLGVEAILEAMQVYCLQQDLGKGFVSPRFSLVPGNNTTWKYRGQILQSNQLMKLEVHLTRIERDSEQVVVTGDASLWADRIRIYELKDAAIRLVEG